MKNDRVSQLANQIPKEIKYTIEALDDDNRLAILVALMKNGKMTFTDLKNTFGINSSSLSHHLALLQNGGLVENFLETGKKVSHSYYNVTSIAKAVLESLFDKIVSVPNIENKPDSLSTVKYHFIDTAANKVDDALASFLTKIDKPNLNDPFHLMTTDANEEKSYEVDGEKFMSPFEEIYKKSYTADRKKIKKSRSSRNSVKSSGSSIIIKKTQPNAEALQ